jgi:hypothetical protein
MRRINLIDVAVFAILSVFFLVIARDVPSPKPYFYDESDYITAGSRGLAANIMERPSMSIVTFLQTGLNRDAQAKRTSLSEIVRGMKDISFYRHYHGPVYYYWLAAIGPFFHFDEYAMRFSGLVFHILIFGAIFFGVLVLSGSRIAALISSFLFLFGQSSIGTDVQITPHIPYVLFTTLTLLIFARYLQTGSMKLWYATVVAFAVAFCSIDYAILLAITFAICFLLFKERRPPAGILLRSILVFLGSLAILWPVGLFELSAIKGYFYIAYLAMQRKGSYGDDTPLTIWIRRFTDAPVEYSIDLACLALLLVSFARRKFNPVLVPFFLYAGLMLLTTLKNTSLNPTYVSSILPALAVISGIVLALILDQGPKPVRFAVTAMILAAISASGYLYIQRHDGRAGLAPEETILAALREAGVEHESVLVPYEYLPTISYYFPEMRLHPYLKTDDDDAILAKLRNSRAQAFIMTGLPPGSLPGKLSGQFRVRSRPIDHIPDSVLFRIDGPL